MVSSNRRSVDSRVVKYVPPTFREMTSGNFNMRTEVKLVNNNNESLNCEPCETEIIVTHHKMDDTKHHL